MSSNKYTSTILLFVAIVIVINLLSEQFYLRLEVADEAGNVASHEMFEPVTIDQSRPTVRVRDVRPVGSTGAQEVQRW